MVDVEKIAGSFRSAIQDLLVPELKAINVELKHHGEEFIRIDKRFEAIDRRFEALHQEMNKRFETVDRRFDLFAESMHRLETTQEKILAKLDLKEQLTETAAKTDQLEKRLDDLRSMFLRTTRPAEASHQP